MMSLLPAAAVLLSVVASAAPDASPAPLPNIVIFAPDGLRADRLGVYGYDVHATSPFIDSAAVQGLVFTRTESQASWTLPSFASVFTSRYPHQHKAVEMNARVSPSETMLTEVLRRRGYRTGAFVGGPFLNPEYGFAKAFDVYNAGGWRYFRETLPPALDWIRESVRRKEKAPFFLFVHGNDVHPPFNPALPESVRRRFDPDYKGPADDLLLDYYFVRVFNRYPWSGGPPPDEAYKKKVEEIRADPRSIPHISALYDGQVAQVDEAFQKLWRTLDEEGLLKNTIIVLLADHGLELGERGLLGTGYHTVGLETITHVPLIIWGPGIAPGRNPDVAQLIDVAPTLLSLIGEPAPKVFEGAALRPGAPEHAALGESTTVGGDGSIPLFYLRDPRWKLIYRLDGPVSELYDLAADPRETKDVSKANAAAARTLVEEVLRRTSSAKP